VTEVVHAPYDGVTYSVTDAGSGRTVLLLHGGSGPASVAPFGERLAGDHRVIVPTHPGWGDSVRPEWFTGVGRLAEMYLELLDDLDVTDVLVVGSSIGGWIASEIAVRDRGRRVGGLVLMNAVGPVLPGQAVVGPPAPLPEAGSSAAGAAARGAVAGAGGPAPRPGPGPGPAAFEALRAYGGESLNDPSLLPRLSRISVPTLVVWGQDDTMVSPAFGREYAAAIPGAIFVGIPDAGHVPVREQPEAVLATIVEFEGGRIGGGASSLN
jgi:pimeloyl-ACP methyl ester carboxylesterase